LTRHSIKPLGLVVRDWLGDPQLARCSLEARGLWIDLLCLMHEGTPYGHLTIAGRPMTHRDIASALRRSPRQILRILQELDDAGVLGLTNLHAGAGTHADATDASNTLPITAAKNGAFNCLFSRRMVRDAHVRSVRSAAGAKGGNPLLRKSSASHRAPVAPATTASPPQDLVIHSASVLDNQTVNQRGYPSPAPNPAGQPRGVPAGHTSDLLGATPADAGMACPHDAILSLYEATLPMLPKLLRKSWLDSSGARALAARWASGVVKRAGTEGKLPAWMSYASEADGLVAWRAFFERVAASELLTGKRGSWKADLRWLVNRTNFEKVLEGRYFDSPYSRVSPTLEQFLKAYPRRGEDPAAVAVVWNTLKLDGQIEGVLTALRAWCACEQWTADGGRFVPAATRWLKARSFESQPPAPSTVTDFPARRAPARSNGALWAEPNCQSTHPDITGDWRVIRFPGGLYLLSEDAIVFDAQAQRAQSLLAPFYAHGRIADMARPPERVRLMVESYRRGQLIKPDVPLRDDELPLFPPDTVAITSQQPLFITGDA